MNVVTHWNGVLRNVAQVFLSKNFEMLNCLVVFMTQESLYLKLIPPPIFLGKGFKNDKTKLTGILIKGVHKRQRVGFINPHG